MKSWILEADSSDSFREKVFANKDLVSQSTVSLVFLSDRALDKGYLQPLKELGLPVFGTCAAELICQDKKSMAAIVALFLDIPKESFQISKVTQNTNSLQLGVDLAKHALNSYSNPALLLYVAFKDLKFEPEKVIEGILSTKDSIPIFGGIPSSIGVVDNPPFFDSEDFYAEGVLALLLDTDKIEVSGLAVSGWQELGTSKRITKSQGRKVLEIEGLPATEFYSNYFGITDSLGGIRKNHIDPDLLAASEYPLLLRKEDGTEVMRVAIQWNFEEGSVSFGGEIPEGSVVRFCSPNTLQTIQKSYEEVKSFRETLYGKEPDLILLFNCAIRSRSLGSYMNLELAAMHKLWGKEVVGFSSWGEIGNAKTSRCGLHNTVISLVALRDKRYNRIQYLDPRQRRIQAESPINIEEPLELPQDKSSLEKEILQLRRDKRILGHFLRLTSDDLEKEEIKTKNLLLNILPKETANRLRQGETNLSERVPEASVLFSDLVGFTKWAKATPPGELVQTLNQIFTAFDEMILSLGVEKIKTIGDAYMVASGVPIRNPNHLEPLVQLAKQMLLYMNENPLPKSLGLQLRVGIHSGEVTAGVIGKHKFTYDLWGDTVNLAQRMESTAEPGYLQVSEFTFHQLKNQTGFRRREVEAKGLGTIFAYQCKAELL